MKSSGKLMDMLTGYAAAHQHPFNIAGLRDGLFTAVQQEIEQRRAQQAG